MVRLTRREIMAAAAAASATAAAPPVFAQDTLPHALKPGKPYAGTKLNVLAVGTPQFEGLQLRGHEFTAMTGIEVAWTFVPYTALQEKVTSTGVAGDGSFDVVNYMDTWGPPNAYWLLALDDLMEEDGITLDRYPPAFAKTVRFDDATTGFPLRSHAQLFFYRKDVLGDVGFQAAPKSWEEVVAVGRAIRAKRPDIEPLALYYHNDGNRQNLFIWLNFLWGAGADVFDDAMKPAFASEAGLKATADYIALHTKERITNPASISFVEQDARASFQQGKSAMIPIWWWAYSPMTNPNQSVLKPEQVAFDTMPSYNGKTVTFAVSMPYSISQYSENPEAAWEFLKWLSNPDLEKRNAIEREVAGKSIINNVVNHKANLTDPEINRANANVQMAGAKSLENADIMPMIAEWPEIGDFISAAITEAAAGGDVAALMTEAAGQAAEVLERAGYN